MQPTQCVGPPYDRSVCSRCRKSACTTRPNSAAAQVHQRAFWSTPQKVAGTYATLLACMHLGSMPYRSKQFWGRAFSFSPDGLSEEMAEDRPAFSPHQLSGPLGVRPATAAESTLPGTTANLPSGKDHSSRFRPYPVRAHVNDLRFQLRSHPALPPCPRLSVANQRPACPVDPFSCPLPKPPWQSPSQVEPPEPAASSGSLTSEHVSSLTGR